MNRIWNRIQKKVILDRDENKCTYCNTPATGIDHVIPISEGGLTITANGVCCCPPCNYSKHAKLDEKWIIKGLARLIQHGEDINWIGNLRPNELSVIYRFITVLLDHDFTISDIANVTGLSYEEVEGYID